MEEMPANPFAPVEMWTETSVKVRDDDDKEKMVDAKHYHVRYMVGESRDMRFVDAGTDDVDSLEQRAMYVVGSIHRMKGAAFHYDAGHVEKIIGPNGSSRDLKRIDTCEDHEMIEITYESPGVECCAMSKEEADTHGVPLQYMAGYLLGKSDDLYKIAQAKTVLESGKTVYEGIHIIPKAVIKRMDCLSE
ncbi:MAG: hypothetical protein RTU30_15045 [Candidatus Thorarchaeota archaeon]